MHIWIILELISRARSVSTKWWKYVIISNGQKEMKGRREMNVNEKKEIRLVALDLDGTLFNEEGNITKASVETLCRIQKQGVQIVVSSGRDYDGISWEQLQDIPIDYVVTGNGSAVYATKDRKRLFEECMDQEKLIPVLEYILQKEVYMTIFVDGAHYTPMECESYVDNLEIPDYIKDWLRGYQKGLENFMMHMREDITRLQKVTLNFQSAPGGGYLNRKEVKEYLQRNPDIHVVEGGFGNLEFTRKGTNKATGLIFLADYLQIPIEQVMAIGDSENDIEMIESAGVGIAMGNALENVKQAAMDITATNEEDGVAKAIEKYIGN